MNELKKVAVCVAVFAAIAVAFFCWQSSWYEEEPHIPRYDPITEKPVEPTVDVVKAEMWTTPTYVPNTPTPSVTHGEPHTATPTVAPTNTPTPTVKPTEKPYKPSAGVVGEKWCEENGTHWWKPWAWYTAINMVNSPQYRLQLIAKTDEKGVRIVQDPTGEWRYSIALPVYWAGGTPEDIGRCIDIYMANGSVLKCVLGDTKRIEKSLNGEGKWGSKGELIEVHCDGNKFLPLAKQRGDASYLGKEWMGEARKIVVLDMFIEGFGGK